MWFIDNNNNTNSLSTLKTYPHPINPHNVIVNRATTRAKLPIEIETKK
jgi:hypothetical protein